MQRRIFGAILAACIAGASPGVVDAAEYNWRLTHFTAKTSAFYTIMTQPFLDRLAQFLGERISVTGFGGGELAPGFKAYEAVQDGIADMAFSSPLYLVNKDLTNTFVAGHPGGLKADGMLYWLYEGGGQELATAFKRDTMGLHALVAGCVTGEIWHSHKPLQTVEDLKGLRFRTAGAWAAILAERFEAAPVVVPGSELYTLFERKGVDALEWSGLSENRAVGFDKIGPYITLPAPHLNAGCFEIVWKRETWDRLPTDIRQEITALAKLSTVESLLMWKRVEIDAIAKLDAENRAQLVVPSPDLLKAVSDAGRNYVYTAINAAPGNSAWLKRMADSYYTAMDGYTAAEALIAQ